ncbi:NAD-dependent epimerase/dehydratase family protein [Baaleninema simplex]|uniref:NAD-dependent epimerase/dehydratase family protein n=1 Tax=Baaleninema simplex TaxID=2862350 RepID=UPI00034628E3|nr:NAD(P)-dependent oxidoreductase [Baaleninema simplex]
MTKTVLISGANGYFGGIACRDFAANGWRVLTATRKPGADVAIDLDRPQDFAQQTLETPVDLFVHAAAAHDVTCREQPYRSLWRNVAGTRAALDFCVNNDIPKFVYLSTFHVFGRPKGVIDETTTPLPLNDYGLTHLQAEEYVQLYRRQGKIQGLVLRPSNFFGIPADIDACNRWTLTPLGFCREAVELKKIVLRSPGYQKRNFISVWDICETIRSTVDHLDRLSLLHVPGPDTISIRQLAQLVEHSMRTRCGEAIDLVIPDGEPTEAEFHYTSDRIDEFFQPQRHIADFIDEFCEKLYERAKT